MITLNPKILMMPILGLTVLATTVHAQQWVNVWNGTDMTGLYKFGNATSTVTFDSAMIHANGPNSYIATNAEYTHYRTRFDWRQTTTNGNSGFQFHVQQDRVWPVGFECQTGIGDAGSLWGRGVRFNSTGTATTYSPTGAAQTQIGNDAVTQNFHYIRSSNAYRGDNQWNTFEIFVRNDSMEIQINGTVVMRAWRIMASGTPLVRGKIALQIEGSPVDYRNWQVMDLSGATPIRFTRFTHANRAAFILPERFFALDGRRLPYGSFERLPILAALRK